MTDEAKELLIDKGTSLEFGARPLRRAIEHFLEDPMAEDLLRGTFTGKDTITVRTHEVDGEKKIIFEATASEKKELVASGGESKA
jgi:ATP-dependent Clp protease ATP-binding subunit ClpC